MRSGGIRLEERSFEKENQLAWTLFDDECNGRNDRWKEREVPIPIPIPKGIGTSWRKHQVRRKKHDHTEKCAQDGRTDDDKTCQQTERLVMVRFVDRFYQSVFSLHLCEVKIC